MVYKAFLSENLPGAWACRQPQDPDTGSAPRKARGGRLQCRQAHPLPRPFSLTDTEGAPRPLQAQPHLSQHPRHPADKRDGGLGSALGPHLGSLEPGFSVCKKNPPIPLAARMKMGNRFSTKTPFQALPLRPWANRMTSDLRPWVGHMISEPQLPHRLQL